MGMLVFGTLHTNNAPKPSTASSTPFPQKSKTRSG
jgi:Tfp pilus assembly pilus retraction ATPase PilT